MRHAARVAQREHVFSERHDVVGEPRRLEGRVEAANQPGMLGRNAGGTVVRVTPLGLDAADGEQRFPPHVDQIAAERERKDGGLREAERFADPANTTCWWTPAS